MGFPNEKPCSCEVCNTAALEPNSYCIKCEHHGCRRGGPSCPDIERNSNWCDECEEKNETTKIHGKHLCDNCLDFEEAHESDFDDLICKWCNNDLATPFALPNGKLVENPTDMSVVEAVELEVAYHTSCKEEHGTIESRREENKNLLEY